MKILVTGGLGYIGSNVCVKLIKNGFTPIVIDNLSNSSLKSKEIIEKISSHEIIFYQGDIRSRSFLISIFTKHRFFAVMHFAGLKIANESMHMPLRYYDNNVNGTVNLISIMSEHGLKNIIFSSSAAVYGNPNYLPIDENHTLEPINPYGKSKMITEKILNDLYVSDPEWSIISLRYFNPVGSDSSGLLYDNPKNMPTNLMPVINKVANKEIKELTIYGDDFETKDGTGIRDYIHISDLADGHISALDYIISNGNFYKNINLGSGSGISVLEIIKCFEDVNRIKINYKIGKRREGDLSSSYASAKNAKKILNWKATRSIEDMCRSSFRNKSL